MTRPTEPAPAAGASGRADSRLREALEALRACCRGAGPLIVEHDWGHYYAYGAPRIFAYVWPQPTHVTLGLLDGARLRHDGRRLLGRGPALRTLIVRSAAEIDAEVAGLMAHAAELALNNYEL
jgi:hypothetical protein